jgi:predicted CoA-binding protein
MNEQHYLTPLFEPRSVAIIGATEREGSLGSVVVRNMLEAGFKGKLFAVNPKYEQVLGVPCYRSVEDIPHRLDLAIITTKADRVPAIATPAAGPAPRLSSSSPPASRMPARAAACSRRTPTKTPAATASACSAPAA